MTIRVAFSLLILAAAAAYTWTAFADLNFMVRGRLGPGFFPRIIGISLIGLTLYSLVVDVRRVGARDKGTPYLTDLMIFSAYCVGLVALMPLLGGVLAMVVFMLAALFTFNRRRPLINIAISVVLPICLYLLFDVWLRAAFATGKLPVPW